MSTKTSLPPLKAQKGSFCPTEDISSFFCTTRTVSSRDSRANLVPGMEGMMPTARSLRRTVAGRLRFLTHSRREASARSRSSVIVSCFQVSMLGTIHVRRGWCLSRYGESGSYVNKKLLSPPWEC